MNISLKNSDLPPFKPLPQKPPSIEVTRKPDGTIYVASRYPLGQMHRSIAHLLEEKASLHPERNFIAERTPLAGGKLGDWRYITYGEANAKASAVAQALIDRGLGPDTPLMVISGNSIVHAVMMLGAMKARVPVAPVSVAYSLMSGDHSKLRHVFETAKPKMIFAEQGPLYARALAVLPLDGVEVVTVMPIPDRPTTSFEDLIRVNVGPQVAASMEKIDHGTVAKYLFTSGSTGMPKGVLHTTAGYLLYAKMTSKYVFDLRPEDVYWCTADVGWVTGHSYVVYGPLANGATSLMYEGAPNYPEPDRFWRIVAKHGVSILYTAPTAIRAFMKWGRQWPDKHDLSSLRLLGTVGEPINPEAWMWFREVIGQNRCPIVDTWWQTETGGIMITPLPGATPTKPGTATLPFFGVAPEVVDDLGKPVPKNCGGKLVIRRPWPGMLRGIWGDPDRFRQTYWSEIEGAYFTGDGCRQDKDGYFWIVGRIDDVLNVAGHRIGTAEVESALVSHPNVAEAAVVGRSDDLKGQALVAFVTLKTGVLASPGIREELRLHVAKEIGPVAKPDDIRFAELLPKTRSGKIMRRRLKQIAGGGEIKGDTTTLEDFSVLARLAAAEE